MLNLPFCWQQNVFSSLQSKSTFSYLFSFAFIQKQLSVISWGLICNQREDWFITRRVFRLPQNNHYVQTRRPTAASQYLWSNPYMIFLQSVFNKIQFLQEVKLLLGKKLGMEAEWKEVCFISIILLRVFNIMLMCPITSITQNFPRLCNQLTVTFTEFIN